MPLPRALGFALLLTTACQTPEGDGLTIDQAGRPFATTEEVVSGASTGPGGDMPSRTCANVASFTSSAAPLLNQYCVLCHNGTKVEATSLFDLQTLGDASADGQQYACDSALSTANQADLLASTMFLLVEPGSTLEHDFRFGTQDDFVRFRDGVMTWLATE